ncbi:hypothetical protein HBI50_004820 [Parastagonospora nodorum]|nr:hypothetical protein HBI50_004820 [Parastagonospora nodorum]
MSYNHQRAPAAQPETGSSGFGADCFDSMVSIDDNFNVYYGGFEDTLRLEDVDWAPFTCGIAPGEILQAPEYAGAGQFDLNGLEPSANFRQDFSAQQPPIFSSADADALFAGLGPDASLPVVEQQNNQALDEFQRDLAPLVSAPASAASTPVADHFTSDADLPVDDEELEDDSNSLFSDTPSAAESPVQEHFTSDDDLTIENEQPHQNVFNIEVPASAGAHQSETDYLHLDDMALEQQQQLWNFVHGADQQSLPPYLLPSAGAFENGCHLGSDGEALIEQSQHTFNTYQNLQQSPPESNIASSDGSSQLQVQANSTSDAPAPMSEQQLEMFRRHMATQLNRPGLTKQAKFDYLRSVPAHIMDQLRIAHPMPSAQHRATAPEVPGQTSQQNSAMYQQSDVSYQPQAQSARIPPQQNFSMLYGSAEPSQPQVPSFQPPQKNGFMFQDAMAPFPSQTPLTHGSPLQNSAMFLQSTGPSHSQASLARGSPVQSLQPARKARGRRPAPIAKPAPFTQLSADDCINMMSPTPSALSDEGFNSEAYVPLIPYVAPEMDPDNLPMYPEYSGTFKTGGQARRFRKRITIPPKPAADLVRVKKYGRHYWVHKIYDAMIDISNMIDGPTSTNRRRFEDEPFWDSQDLEAVAHNIFDATVAVHDRGWNRLSTYHKKTVRGKLLDKAMQSVETRLAMVCDLLRTSKAVVDDCLRGGVTLALVVDNPACRKATKESNNAGNNKRGIRLAFVKKVLEKEQGRPVTEEQVAELEKQVEQEEEDERVRNRERVKASQKVHRDAAKAKAEAARM